MTFTKTAMVDSRAPTSSPYITSPTHTQTMLPTTGIVSKSQPSTMPLDDGDDDTLLDVSATHADRLHLNCKHHCTLSPLSAAFDAECLDGLDDALMISPVDAFADLCYAQCTYACDAGEGSEGLWKPAASSSCSPRPGPRSDSSHGSDSDSDWELTTPTDGHCNNAPRWRMRARAQGADEGRRVTFAPLPRSAGKVGAPALCGPEATMAFLLPSMHSDPNESVHFFPTWPEKRRPERSTIKALMMRGLAAHRMRSGLPR